MEMRLFTAKEMSKLSVIITAYDQHRLTVAHVKNCMLSTYIPKEVIVVNDGGDPTLKEMLKEIPLRSCTIIYAYITQDIPWNQQGARNLGFWLSSGDYIANEDNDHIPGRSFYQGAVDYLDSKEYDIVTVKKRHVVNQEDIFNEEMSDWKTLKCRGRASIISTVRREVISYIKGFDEQFSGHYGWEIPDWVYRTNLCGFKTINDGIYYTPAGVYSREKDRVWDGKRYRMDAVNYHHCRRNSRNGWSQSPIGILNFKFEVEKICENLFQLGQIT